MKAAVYRGERNLPIEQIDRPTVKPGWVLLNVAYNGICGSDLHAYLEGEQLGMQPGIVIGHEFSGTVTEIGEGVTRAKVGDKVVVAPLVYCGKCYYCRQGLYNLCESMGFYGSVLNGGLEPYVLVPEDVVFQLPDNLSLEEGALTEPLAVAFHAVRRSRLAPGESAFISGAGPIGLAAIASAVAAGASKIIVSEISRVRQQKAWELGATHVLNPTETDVVRTVHELTGGLGTDVALEAAGVQPALDVALQSTRKGGRFVQIALWGESPRVDMMMNVMKETEMIFSLAYSFVEEFPDLLELMSKGTIQPKKLITDVIPLDDVVKGGFEELLNNRDAHAKILVNPNA